MPIARMQLGKNGITDNFISSLKNVFNTHNIVKIAVHQNKEETKKMAEEIIKKLGSHYTSRIIGFTIVVKKWRKARINLKH